MKYKECGHYSKHFMISKDFPMHVYFLWKDTVGFDGDKTQCFMCYFKEYKKPKNLKITDKGLKELLQKKDELMKLCDGEEHRRNIMAKTKLEALWKIMSGRKEFDKENFALLEAYVDREQLIALNKGLEIGNTQSQAKVDYYRDIAKELGYDGI
jgi:hypothetical protein